MVSVRSNLIFTTASPASGWWGTRRMVKAAEQLFRAKSCLFMIKRFISGLLLTART